MPGGPDIVLPKYKAVVFVHGCFWHRHPGCEKSYRPKTREGFWEKKFAENVARDRRNIDALRRSGWRVLVVWECEVSNTETLVEKLQSFLHGLEP